MSTFRVDRERWFAMSLMEQMGNIGSEVGRSIKAHQAGDQLRFEAALTRALDLFNATAEGMVRTPSTSYRAREVLRARDEFLGLFFGDTPATPEAAASLERYFFQFALAARSTR